MPQKRAFADSTIKIQESSSSDSDEELPQQMEATPGDTKIVLNLFDEDCAIEPPLKKKKVEERKPQVVATPEPFFKS